MDKDYEENCVDQSDKIYISATMTNNSDTQEIERISVRPPKFNKKKSAIWFIQMKAQFACNEITKDLIKFYHVLQSLDSDVEVSELVTNPPQYGKYEITY